MSPSPRPQDILPHYCYLSVSLLSSDYAGLCGCDPGVGVGTSNSIENQKPGHHPATPGAVILSTFLPSTQPRSQPRGDTVPKVGGPRHPLPGPSSREKAPALSGELKWRDHVQMHSWECTQNSGSLDPEGPGDSKASCGTEDKTHNLDQAGKQVSTPHSPRNEREHWTRVPRL